MSVENDRRHLLERAALRSGRGFAEQFKPSKDDLRQMLADAIANTASLTSQQSQASDHQS